MHSLFQKFKLSQILPQEQFMMLNQSQDRLSAELALPSDTHTWSWAATLEFLL
jgi:hypothetical protein